MSVVSVNERVLEREPAAAPADDAGQRPHDRPTGRPDGQARWSPPVRAMRRVPPGRDPIELEGLHARAMDLARAIASRVRERPLASIAAAVGIGFLVGGALTFRAGRIALAAAVRHVAREVLKQVL